MNILAIDTSTPFASVALGMNEQVVAESLLGTQRTLSARLVPEIERLLATAGLEFSNIDLFASSIGPGSFTGVRGGVATIQGLALALGKPCFGFSSLAMLAMNCSLASMPVCPMLDARKSEVYAALYDCTSPIPVPRMAESVLPPAAFLDRMCAMTGEPVLFVGDGALCYRELITERMQERALFAPFPHQVPHAANGILLALQASRRGELLEPAQLLPSYLRASDAELNLLKTKPLTHQK